MAENHIYSRSEDEWNHCESIEEAAQEAYEYLTDEEREEVTEVTIYQGTPDHVSFSDFFCVDSLIERVQENAYDNYGEHASDYLDDVTEEQKEELKELVLVWSEKVKAPRFYMVKNVKEIKHPITEDMKS